MCGIYGYYTNNEAGAIHCKPLLSRLIEASTIRGTDATGIAYINGKLNVLKKPVSGHDYIKTKAYKDTLKAYTPHIVIGHDRATTQGLASDNKNNHPIHTGTLALVHNGIISNDQEVIKRYKLTSTAVVDSEAIALLIAHYTKKYDTIKSIKLAVNKLTGSQACALIDTRTPDTLYLWRTTNPLTLAYHKPTGSILFASTENILTDAISLKRYFMGIFIEEIPITDYVFYDVPINTGLAINTKISLFVVDPAIATYTSQAITKTRSFDVYCPDCLAYHPTGEHTKKQSYTEYEPIIKPSKASTIELNARLDILDGMQVKHYLDYHEEQEQRRIINALSDRRNRELELFD